MIPTIGSSKKLMIAAAEPQLTIVGTGIAFQSHATVSVMEAIKTADLVCHLLVDETDRKFITTLNDAVEDMTRYFSETSTRKACHDLIVSHVLDRVQAGLQTVFAVYGHPTEAVYPSRALARHARKLKIPYRILPGVSASACLYSSLEIDPVEASIISMEATGYLERAGKVPRGFGILLWQCGMICETKGSSRLGSAASRRRLASKLAADFGARHECYIFQASRRKDSSYLSTRLSISELEDHQIEAHQLLFIPALVRTGLKKPSIRLPWRWPNDC